MSSFMVCVVLVVVVGDAAVIKEGDYELGAGKAPFELDELLMGTFKLKSWNGTWLLDNKFFYRDEKGNILLYNLDKKASDILLPNEVLRDYGDVQLSLSPDQGYVLIQYNKTSVFRHSTTAQYTVYDIAKNEHYHIANEQPIQLIAFAPKGHNLVYVFQNNIYLLDDFSVDASDPITVTNIGIPGIIYCGIPDWIYEEEIFQSPTALWFSPNGTQIAYATFRDENVPTYSYFIYGQPGSICNQYPETVDIRYPKAGQNNPLVQIYLYDIATQATLEFRLPPSINNKFSNDFVLFGVVWISEFEVALVTANRVQNQTFIIRCGIHGGCIEEATYVETNGWFEPMLLPKYSLDGKQRLEILAQPEGDDHYFHLVLTDIDKNDRTRLTYGRHTVIQIYGWDRHSGLIYYGASVNDTPSQQHVYVVSTEGEQQCLTCSMVVDGKKCTFASASFSENLSYYAKVCGGPGPYLTEIESTKNANDVVVWEDNAAFIKNLTKKEMPIVKNLEVPVTSEFKARVRLWLPPHLDESSSKKYPAIVYVYAGPSSNQINDLFVLRFEHYLVTKREYIHIYIDGRGSGRDGLKKMFQIYRRLGTVEVEDQITVTRYLQEHLPYIDAKRTGIWGWSYGAFAASWALAKDKEHIFNFGLAVAPVTSFIYYDTIYTERYMGLPTPEDNEAGYNDTDLTRVAEAFRGRRYFIIHGNADDNVHYHNTQALVKALEHADIDFMQQSYPDENHQLFHVSKHLYHTFDKYFATCFDVEGPPVTSWNNKEAR